MKHTFVSSVLIFLFAAFSNPPLQAGGGETLLFLRAGQNRGKHVFAAGAKMTLIDLSNLGGAGSRLLYPRNFNYIKPGIQYNEGFFELEASIFTTGWYVKTGKHTNEDFFLALNSPQKGAKISLLEGKIYDTPYTFTPTRNFAESHSQTRMSSYGNDLYWRYFFSANKHTRTRSGFYLSGGIRYEYYKYYNYDLLQYYEDNTDPNRGLAPGLLAVPGPIGSYSHAQLELLLGAGYRLTGSAYQLDLRFLPLIGEANGRDHHGLRGLNIFHYTSGSGFLYTVDFTYNLYQNFDLGLSFSGHRFYGQGPIETTAGYYLEDRLLASIPGGWNYLGVKESALELSVKYRLAR